MPTKYLNTDLEISADFNLQPLVNEFESKGLTCLMVREEESGHWIATLETNTLQWDATLENYCSHDTATPDILILLDFIESLEGRSRESWNNCQKKNLNIGIEGGDQPFAFETWILPETLHRFSQLGVGLGITLYAFRRKDLPNFARRSAVEEDVPFLIELRRQTMEEHQTASGVRSSQEESLRRVMLRLDLAEILLLDGNPVGMVKLIREGDPWCLLQIQVVPEHQGKGIGRQIIQEFLNEARRMGVKVALHVYKANPARLLYANLGFRVVSKEPHSFVMEFSPDLTEA